MPIIAVVFSSYLYNFILHNYDCHLNTTIRFNSTRVKPGVHLLDLD